MKFDFTQTWTQTFFLAISHSVTLECFLRLCEALNRSYFCPIRLIRWKLILSLMTESRRDESHQSCSSFLDICSLLDKKVIRVIMQRNEIFVVFIQILPVHSKFNNELCWEIHRCPLVMIYISGVWLCWQIEGAAGVRGTEPGDCGTMRREAVRLTGEGTGQTGGQVQTEGRTSTWSTACVLVWYNFLFFFKKKKFFWRT